MKILRCLFFLLFFLGLFSESVQASSIRLFSHENTCAEHGEFSTTSEEIKWLHLLYLKESGKLAIHPLGAVLPQENQKFAKNPELVNSWRVLDDAGVDDIIRKNPKALEIINSAQKGEFGTSISKTENRVTVKSANGDDLLKFEGDQLKVGKYDIKADPSNTSIKSADEVNASYPDGWEPPYNNSVNPIEFKTASNEQFVRVYVDGVSNPNGPWIMKQSEIEGLTPAQIKDKFAIPGDDLPDKVVDVSIPEGTRLRTGKAGPTSGGNGGGTQFEIPYPDPTPIDWYTNPRSL